MLVTPVGTKFNQFKVGDTFNFPDKLALVLIKLGRLAAVETRALEADISPRTGRPKRQYRRRDMQAEA